MAAEERKKNQGNKKRAPAKNSKRQAPSEAERKNREIAGIVVIALGVFLGLTHLSGTGIVGEKVSGFTFGLTGVFGYALPFVLVAQGFYTIATAKKHAAVPRSMLIVAIIVMALSFIHVFFMDRVEATDYITSLFRSFELGEKLMSGGGLLGALLAYPAVALLGKAGACVLFPALTLIMVVALTNISLQRTGEKVGKAIKTNVTNVATHIEQKREVRREERRTRLDTEELEVIPASEEKKKKEEEKHKEPEAEMLIEEEKPGFAGEDVDLFPSKGKLKRQEKPIGFWKRRRFPSEEELLDELEPFKKKEEPGEMEAFLDDVTEPFAPETEPEPQTAFEQDREEEELSQLAARDFGEYEKYLPPLEGIERGEAPAFETEERKKPAEPILREQKPVEKAVQMTLDDAPKNIRKYQAPPISFLKLPKNAVNREDPMAKAKLLEQALASFGITAKVTDVVTGPVITRYELQPAPGVRVNRITNLSDDIALCLAAPRVRIQAPIPGKSVIGIEVPNKVNAVVTLREIIDSQEFKNAKSSLTVALGKDIAGKLAMTDISKMPHLLIAGSTGSGKSVCINCIVCSIIYHASPEDVRLIMVDPKVVELSVFGNIPHLLIPVVTEPKQAAGALKWAVTEMIQRFNLFKTKSARDIARYNEIMLEEGQPKLPKIVVIVDELADLMMVAPDDVEDSICRIAQLGRAAGIHLVVATQRPSADVITGLIKANILSRIAFAVASSTDSRIILDCSGAEKLLGKGDMLFSNAGGEPKRIQGALVTDTEVEQIQHYFEKNDDMGAFDNAALHGIANTKTGSGTEAAGGEEFEDDLLPDAVEIFLSTGTASISMLQRRMRIGYNRAARLIDLMEEKGIVSGFEGSKPRKLLITRADFAELFGREPNLPDLGS